MAHAATLHLSASLEDYLEAIYRIVAEKQVARAKDVGRRLKVGRSSVTGALHALADRELIHYAPYDLVTLTDRGREVAEGVARRHEVLGDFFANVLAVDPAEADAAACKLEHAVSENVLGRLLDFIDFVDRCPRGGLHWIEGFRRSCHTDKRPGHCEACLSRALDRVQSKQRKEQHMEYGGTQKAGATLADLKPGGKATILTIAGAAGGIRRRLLDMGVTAGTRVEVERVAPLGDPIEVKIKGYHLTLRKEEAARIQVERA
jgi:DtxR family Mn-dependent transcriptional regulator